MSIKKGSHMKSLLLLASIFLLTSCATIVNDPTVPVTLSFSDGSSGTCNLSNKRGSWRVNVPGTHNVRRSDDNLRFDCETDTDKKGFVETIGENDFFKDGHPSVSTDGRWILTDDYPDKSALQDE